MRKLSLLIVIGALLLALFACEKEKDPNWLEEIRVSFDRESLQVTTVSEHVALSTQDLGLVIQLTIDIEDPFSVDQDTKLYVNNELIDKDLITITSSSIMYDIPHPNPVDPESYVDVEITFDPQGGIWPADIFNTFEPEYELTITALNDLSGTTFSLFDNEQTQLRWFYKLFLSYNETYQAYEVVYKDASTASILYLDLPAYDFVIGAHLHTTDVVSRDIMIALSSEEGNPRFVRFDQDPATYTSGDLGISIYTDQQVSGEWIKTYQDIEVLPVPTMENFVFLGWSDGEELHHIFPRYQAKEGIRSLRYEAVWGSYALEDVQAYLETLIPDQTLDHLVLPTTYSGYTITWQSSHPEVIDTEGSYKRPYQPTVVTLTAILTLGELSETLSFDTTTIGYKSLEAPIASSYIYRNFHLVNDAFFETLDIINGAFITADEYGNLTGSAFLSNMETYIFPKARIHGNWVIPSIAPESKWSQIVLSQTRMNDFADNIVELINTYGFDGVDIDWETPTTAEVKSYTELMRIVYTKVKANNPNHLVTTAITGGQWQPPKYDLIYSQAYIDYINVMTYGMTTNGGQYHNALYRATTYHNTQFSAGRTLGTCSIDESVKIFKDSYQVPYSKLIVGAAFYGIRQTRSYVNGAWTAWANAGSVHYTDIASTYANSSLYTKVYDERAGVPYIIKNDGTEFISYDNPKSILEKSEYIINEGLAGMMYWEHGLDATGALIEAIRTGLLK